MALAVDSLAVRWIPMTGPGLPPVAASAEDLSAKERILVAAEELFAEAGFDATSTSKIAIRADVPKGLVHYYFRRKADLLASLVTRLPDETVQLEDVVVRGDVAESLRRLVAELDGRLQRSVLLSHLLWREADTHEAVRAALRGRSQRLVQQVRSVIRAALPNWPAAADVDSAAELIALTINFRHATARHSEDWQDEGTGPMDRKLAFIADALALGAGAPAPG